jgi:hypothetical protein
MAALVNAHIGRRLARLLLAAGALGANSTQGYAQSLADPTRSPLTSRTSAAATEAAPAAAAAPTRVLMIVRGPGETRTAVIDGNNVRVGDTVRLPGGAARVERITDTSVVLARAGGRETLQLLPGLERSVRCSRRPESQRPGGC